MRPSKCFAQATGLAAAAVLALSASANPLPPKGAAPSIDAKAVEGPDATKAWADFIAPWQSPDHPPIHEIPPMPMDDCTDCPEGLFPPEDGVTVHNAVTGETIQIPGDVLRGAGADGGAIPGYTGADGEDLFPESFRGFGTMSAVNNTDAFPWRANTKLVMRFVDQNGITRWFNCSATMVDAAVALTAAHCVYARSPNIGGTNVDIFDWAREVWVYPGWDGVGTQGSDPGNAIIQPYGYARGTFYSAGTGYINNGDFDRDVGVVRLQRPVGMVTGWFGMAWGFGCSTIQGRTYHNAAYPGENCPTAGLHTGRQMYYWFGGIDSCPGNQLQIDTTAGCLTAMWGGMSGSSAYYISDGNRFAHAVASNSNRSTRGRFAKNWEGAFNSWEDFITDTRGSNFDMAPLRMELSQTTIQAGTSPTGTRRHLGTNATNASRNATYTYRVYLSTTPNITTSDTLLSTQTYTWNYGPMSSVNVNMGSFTIPINTSPGTYYIGVIYDNATDFRPSNNATQHWDTQRITVTLAPPAQVTGPNPPNNSFARPVTQNLSWSSAARATSYRVYFGTTPNLTSQDLLATTTFTSRSLPTLNHDTVYYWRIDSVNNAGTTTGQTWSFRTEPVNNNCSGAIDITPGSYSGSTTFNSASGVSGCTGNDTIDSWYRYTPDENGRATVSLCGSNFNTTVSVYSNCAGTRVACNNVSQACGGGLQSQVEFSAEAGQTYRIRVSGWAGATGRYVLDLSLDNCIPDLAPPFGVLDIFDVLEFLTLFESEDPAADLAPPFGVWDIFDVLEFLTLFEQGCP